MRAADTRDAIECWEQTLVDCQSGPLRPRFPHSYDQHCTAVSGSREESGFGGGIWVWRGTCRLPFPKPRLPANGRSASPCPSQHSAGLVGKNSSANKLTE